MVLSVAVARVMWAPRVQPPGYEIRQEFVIRGGRSVATILDDGALYPHGSEGHTFLFDYTTALLNVAAPTARLALSYDARLRVKPALVVGMGADGHVRYLWRTLTTIVGLQVMRVWEAARSERVGDHYKVTVYNPKFALGLVERFNTAQTASRSAPKLVVRSGLLWEPI